MTEKISLTVSVSRFNPYVDTKPHLESYTVSVLPGCTILTVLETIRDTIDSTLSFRSCCRSAQCGSCAVRINGTPGLACETVAKDGDIIEPLRLEVLADLVTDIAPVIARMGGLVPGDTCPHQATEQDLSTIKPLRTCIECFSCVSACPAVNSFAGPTVFAKEARLFFDPRNCRDRLPIAVEKGLFSCTTCRRCVEVCPKKIDVPGKAIEKLRKAAVGAGYFLPAHRSLAELIESTGRSVSSETDTFLAQASEVYEPLDGVACKGTVGFFVGCMFNARVIQPALDTVYVLRRNGYRVVIPKSQVCCGSPLIRTGFAGFVPELQKRNIEAFTGIDTVITVCAGCGSTLKNDYETPFAVYDFTEFLVKEGFEVPAMTPGKYTYHDPCHLLRGQGIKDQPREIIRSCTEQFTDLEARCCGAGGGVRSGKPDEAAEIGRIRSEMIHATGADAVITVCPFCEYHIHQTTGLPVINIASLMADGYRKKDKN
ncbi:MAG TPA: succinate dehydrogenase/fumarate reductase iron-sulfur subunit [Methanocorpusculum sp.]|nr:succinate dehydrogenase/fumarate reductase iron-sulfur subunit [Methanocorpusculum sp.]